MCHNPQHSHSVTLGIWFGFVLVADPSWSVWVQTWRKEGVPISKQHFTKIKLIFHGSLYLTRKRLNDESKRSEMNIWLFIYFLKYLFSETMLQVET